MDLGDCYRLLGLRSGASFADIKTSYRRLAQQYHPDINPDDHKAKDKFIALTEAYKLLLTVVIPENIVGAQSSQSPVSAREEKQAPPASVNTQEATTPKPPGVTAIEQRLKWKTYEQLQQFLKEKRFPQAIALVEALADRLPEDAEVRQWQAITYQIWGRVLIDQHQLLKARIYLIDQHQLLKARIYLKKSLKTDPNNKALWNEVQRDFQRLDQMF